MRGWTNAVSGSQLNLDADYDKIFNNIDVNVENKDFVVLNRNFNTSDKYVTKITDLNSDTVQVKNINEDKNLIIYTNGNNIHASIIFKDISNKLHTGAKVSLSRESGDYVPLNYCITKSNKLILLCSYQKSHSDSKYPYIITAQLNLNDNTISNIKVKKYNNYNDRLADNTYAPFYIQEIFDDKVLYTYIKYQEKELRLIDISNIDNPVFSEKNYFGSDVTVENTSSSILSLTFENKCIFYTTDSPYTTSSKAPSIFIVFTNNNGTITHNIKKIELGSLYSDSNYIYPFYLHKENDGSLIFYFVNRSGTSFFYYTYELYKININNSGIWGTPVLIDKDKGYLIESFGEVIYNKLPLYYDGRVFIYACIKQIYDTNSSNQICGIYAVRQNLIPILISNGYQVENSKNIPSETIVDKNMGIYDNYFLSYIYTYRNVYDSNMNKYVLDLHYYKNYLNVIKDEYKYSPLVYDNNSIYIRYNSKV